MAEVLQLGFYDFFSCLDWMCEGWGRGPLKYQYHHMLSMHAMTSHCPLDHPVDMVLVKFILYFINFFPNFTQ